MAQFVCRICDEGFEQRSRYDRHMASAHPEPAPSAADVARALAGIDFPAPKRTLVNHASKRAATKPAVLHLIRSLPDWTYRDAAEVAIAIGERKSGGPMRKARAIRAKPAPGRKGGLAAAKRRRRRSAL